MAQVTRGVRAILNVSVVYQAYQALVGATRERRIIVDEYLRPSAGQTLLDVGCGPADILGVLPDIEYIGVDADAGYLERAERQFKGRGRFYRGDIYTLDAIADRQFDAILAVGLLHHLNDAEVETLFGFAVSKLARGGRMVTIDPCFTDQQGPLERTLIRSDRGKNVRRPHEYRALAATFFERVEMNLRRDLLRIPYTHCILTSYASDLGQGSSGQQQ
jgi:cyclopropane fatty-acyl-phospholipid synthase-like methyltransferase